MTAENNTSDRTLTIEKTFNAPVQLVWDAWSKPEHIVQWWAPPGMEAKVVEHEFRVGGKWKYTMPMPDGNEFVTDGVYTVIEKLKKIFSSANFRPMTEGVEMQCLFQADGDQTLFTFHMIHPTKAYKDQQEQMGFFQGWGSTFERLAEWLED